MLNGHPLDNTLFLFSGFPQASHKAVILKNLIANHKNVNMNAGTLKLYKRMYKRFIIAILTLLLIMLMMANRHGHSSEAPRVIFYYSPTIDQVLCPENSRKKITDVWLAEFSKKKPWLEKAWYETGSKLLRETVKEVGKPFSYTEIKAHLFLCPDLPGFSFPLMIPVRTYLNSAVNGRTWHESEFVDMVYHEILHFYVAKALNWNYWTPLLRKYHHEDFNTQIHLHLFALQKAVYLKLGIESQWEFIVIRLKKLAPQYLRAIEIVNKEGYQPFLEELRN